MPSVRQVNQAPDGTRLWLMNLGLTELDDAYFIRGANASTLSNPRPEHKRRKAMNIAVLIDHPTEGLIVFETGPGPDYPEVWGPPFNDLFVRCDYVAEHELDRAIEMTGHNIKDVNAVVMGHLHLDHAGGLSFLKGTEVPVYVHEIELKHAFFSVLTKTDMGVYIPQTMHTDINWKPIYGDSWELCPGVNLQHAPGHTPGLMMMQVNLKNSGT